jgi:hypothetical protein
MARFVQPSNRKCGVIAVLLPIVQVRDDAHRRSAVRSSLTPRPSTRRYPGGGVSPPSQAPEAGAVRMSLPTRLISGISDRDPAPPGLIALNERGSSSPSSFLPPEGSTSLFSQDAGLPSTPHFGVRSPGLPCQRHAGWDDIAPGALASVGRRHVGCHASRLMRPRICPNCRGVKWPAADEELQREAAENGGGQWCWATLPFAA